MELNDILNKMENEGWKIDSDFKDAHKPFLQYFLETVEEQCNIANVVGRSEQFYCLNRSIFGDGRKCVKQCLSCEKNIPKQ